MKKRFYLPVILFFIFAALAAWGSSDSNNSLQPLSQEIQAEIERIVADTMTRHNAPGVVVGVWKTGCKPWIKAVGVAEIKSGEALKVTDRFRIASNTKTFTATVILQLVDEGRLSLEDTLDLFLPEIPGSDKITVRNLLNMTSGLFEYIGDPVFIDAYLYDPLRVWTHQEIIDNLISHAPYEEPGAELEYSNANYYLLGMIIEQVTGSTAEEEIYQRIIVPLGLEVTGFPTQPEIAGAHSHGYRDEIDDVVLDQLEDITLIDPSCIWTAGGMVSTLADLKIWVQALAEGTLISEAAQQQRLQWVEMAEGVEYGLGVANIGGLIGHTGGIHGFNSGVFYLPESGSTLIVLVNKFNSGGGEPAQDIYVDIAKLVFPDEFTEPGKQEKE